MDLIVSPRGEFVGIYNEVIDLSPLGKPRIERASHVEPDEHGRWFARIVEGPTLGPFKRRSSAITAEIDWLTKHRLPG